MNKRIRRFLPILLLVSSTSGCDSPTSSVISDLQLRLAAQTPIHQHVRSVVVNLSGVSVRSTANSTFGSPGTSSHIVDLAELGGSNTRILEVFSLTEGRYDAVRMNIHEVSVTLSNGARFDETYPDPQGREMIVVASTPMVVEPGRKADAVIDFDLMRSISLEGDVQRVHDITGMRVTPVGRLVDLASSGQVSGSVRHDNGTPAVLRDDVSLRGYPVTFFQPGRMDSVTVYSGDNDRYAAYFLPAGSYAMYGPPTEETAAWSAENVVVTTASTTRQDVIVAKR